MRIIIKMWLAKKKKKKSTWTLTLRVFTVLDLVNCRRCQGQIGEIERDLSKPHNATAAQMLRWSYNGVAGPLNVQKASKRVCRFHLCTDGVYGPVLAYIPRCSCKIRLHNHVTRICVCYMQSVHNSPRQASLAPSSTHDVCEWTFLELTKLTLQA